MLGRLSALATIATLLACGGDPAPREVKKPKAERGSDEARSERKRQTAEERRRQEQEEADEREREERLERKRKREAAQESSEPAEKRVADRDEPAESDDADSDDADAQERRARKERIRQREEEEAREAARIARAEEKKNKREAAREAKLAKAEAEKAKKAKKKNVEEVDDDDDIDDEEAGRKAKNVEDDDSDEVADNKTKRKNAEEDESDESDDSDDGGSKTSPFKKTRRKQTAAEKKAAAKKLAAEKKAAEKQAAADKAAERKAAADAKKQAAADKKAAAKQAAADKKTADKTAKKKAEDEDVADEDVADEDVAHEDVADDADQAKSKQVANKRKATAKTDEVDESEIEVDTASLPPPDPSEESNELDLSATPTRDEEPVVIAPKVYAIDRRPLTLGRGKIDVHGGLVATAVTASNGMGGTTTASAQGLALGATYGIGAKGELGIDYTLGLHPGDAQGPFMLHGAYVAKQTEKLDIALSIGLAFDFVDSIDPGTMMTTTRTAKALQVGVWARYHLGPKLSAFSGLPGLPSSAGNLGATAPLPPVPYQLSVGLSSVDAIALDIPAGLGYQATPKLYTFGVLDLAHLGMNNTTSAVLFSDFIPLSLGGFYAASKMDIGAVFSDDLKQGADYLRFDVVVRYSIK